VYHVSKMNHQIWGELVDLLNDVPVAGVGKLIRWVKVVAVAFFQPDVRVCQYSEGKSSHRPMMVRVFKWGLQLKS
jgi:hypothetical protein